jgi:hypothetical protein
MFEQDASNLVGLLESSQKFVRTYHIVDLEKAFHLGAGHISLKDKKQEGYSEMKCSSGGVVLNVI